MGLPHGARGTSKGRAVVRILTFLAFLAGTQLTAQTDPRSAAVAADIAYLASDLLEGRAIGTAGGDSATMFLARRYAGLNVRGAFPAQCPSPAPCGAAYFQIFEFEGVRAENVVALVPGADPSSSGRYVVVGAHYDHLGRAGLASLDPSRGNAIRPGADDNASGTAALLEVGRRLALSPAPVPVLLAHFDAEEVGLVGSRIFVDHPPIPLDSVDLMINLDMIGRLGPGSLNVELAADHLEESVSSLAGTLGLSVEATRRITGRSDHASFSRKRVPSVALFTGFHDDYHRVTDTPDKVDVVGVLRIVDLVEALVRSVAALPEQR